MSKERKAAIELLVSELNRTKAQWPSARYDDTYGEGELVDFAESIIHGFTTFGFDKPIFPYPRGWDKKYFRDYGGAFNLIVAATALINEVERRLRAGETIARKERED